jgi:polyhydroxybutyrate depolymerase
MKVGSFFKLSVTNIVLFITLLVFIPGCAPSGSKPLKKNRIRIQEKSISVEVNGAQRKFLLVIPGDYKTGLPVPLVFDFHGTGSNPKRQIVYSDFANLAGGEGFLLVAPVGVYSNGGRPSWNAPGDPTGVDDIAFVKSIIEAVATDYPIDRKRIYATGMSGGGRMSSRIGCDLAEVFAAIAPVAGVQFLDNCSPARAIPVLIFHGKKDAVNSYVHNVVSPPYWKHGVEYSVNKWVENNGCDREPDSDRISDVVTKLSWSGCNSNADVVFYRIDNGGHTWPGSPVILTTSWSGKTNTDIVASDLIWAFFKAHPLP